MDQAWVCVLHKSVVKYILLRHLTRGAANPIKSTDGGSLGENLWWGFFGKWSLLWLIIDWSLIWSISKSTEFSGYGIWVSFYHFNNSSKYKVQFNTALLSKSPILFFFLPSPADAAVLQRLPFHLVEGREESSRTSLHGVGVSFIYNSYCFMAAEETIQWWLASLGLGCHFHKLSITNFTSWSI